jgi:ribosome-associated heat shock protein Hsp15
MSDHGGSEDSLRIDKLLWYLRLTKSRERAQAKIAEGHIRVDGRRVERASMAVRAGAVIVLPISGEVTVVRVDRLPQRRGPAPEAQAHYTLLTNRGNASDSQLSETISGIGRDLLDGG